ncbi:MAG: ABC transporter ATP-binding protein [Candidatus Methanofastidiosa archaeon]|nr:ABC transporter ATP-binding protein [Candidatus Methanofastidiosa archaeon]
MDDYLINIENITKDFGNLRALDDVSLKIKKGETFGLLGPNGAGKTTLVRILCAVLTPTSGNGTINGLNLLEEKNGIKRMTGLLPENPGTYEDLTSFEFLSFVGELYSIEKKTIDQRISDLLKLFDIYDRKDDLISGFSSGMKQKVMLASTLIHNPPLLFLDEPTSALDPTVARTVKDIILSLSKEAQRTIVISTHQLPLAEEVCDRIALLHRGKVLECGSPRELMEISGTNSLEKAFFKITNLESKDVEILLGW